MTEAPKRFVVFYGDVYYPAGGWNDAAESFEDIEVAKAFLAGLMHQDSSCKWGHIADMATGQII